MVPALAIWGPAAHVVPGFRPVIADWAAGGPPAGDNSG
jgi:hypothetical protein